MAAELDVLEMFVDNDRLLPFAVVDLDADPTGATPKNLTGITVQWALTKFKGGKATKAPVLSKTTVGGAGVQITNAVGGLCEVTIDAADTINLQPGDYYHELEVIDGSGRKLVVATGPVTLKLNVENP